MQVLLGKVKAGFHPSEGDEGAGLDAAGPSTNAAAEQPASPTATSPSAAKKRRRASLPAPPDVVEQAVTLLERSFCVSEKGISAYDTPVEKLQEVAEPDSSASASWRAWKRVSWRGRCASCSTVDSPNFNRYTA